MAVYDVVNGQQAGLRDFAWAHGVRRTACRGITGCSLGLHSSEDYFIHEPSSSQLFIYVTWTMKRLSETSFLFITISHLLQADLCLGVGILDLQWVYLQ